MYIDSINFPSMTYLSILLMVSFDEQKIQSLLWLILSVLRNLFIPEESCIL